MTQTSQEYNRKARGGSAKNGNGQRMDGLDDNGPVNLEAEQIVLATMMGQNRIFELNAERLSGADFHDPLHMQIYAAIGKLVSKGRRAEPATIVPELTESAPINGMKASAYLETLRNMARPLDQVDAFIEKIVDASIGRRIRKICQKYDTLAKTGQGGIIDQLSADVTEAATTGAPETYAHVSQHADGVLEDILAHRRAGGGIIGIRTGFDRFDRLIRGLRPSTMTVIAARPKQGKTALGLTIIHHVLKQGIPVCFFSIEMPRQQIYQRLYALESGISFEKLLDGTFDDREADALSDAVKRVKAMPLFLDDKAGISASAMHLRARHAVKMDGARLILIDYLQLIRAEARGSRYEDVTEASMAVAEMRKQLDVPIIALAQLNRKATERSTGSDFSNFKPEAYRPRDGDLRESGQIEQDADAVCFIYRPEVQLEDLRPTKAELENSRTGSSGFSAKELEFESELVKYRGRAELIVHMNRAGKRDTVNLFFDGPKMQFRDS